MELEQPSEPAAPKPPEEGSAQEEAADKEYKAYMNDAALDKAFTAGGEAGMDAEPEPDEDGNMPPPAADLEPHHKPAFIRRDS